jgi:membrane protease YdiL (CAAX protease family)
MHPLIFPALQPARLMLSFTGMTTYTFVDAALPNRTLEIDLAETRSERVTGSAGIFLIGLLPTAVAVAGVALGTAWLGHAAYKFLLLALPLILGWRFSSLYPIRRAALTPAILSGLALGGTAAVGLAVLLPALREPALIRASLDARYGLTPVLAIVFALFNMTVNAVLEEVFYRGLLAPRLGTIVSTTLFALQHVAILAGPAGLPAALAAGGCTFLAGVVWCGLAARHGLAAAAISHIAADLVVLSTGLWLLGYL